MGLIKYQGVWLHYVPLYYKQIDKTKKLMDSMLDMELTIFELYISSR